MGYTTDFTGEWKVTPPLTKRRVEILTKFAGERHEGGTFPDYWCQWVPTSNGEYINWDGGEKFYEYGPWIEYLIKTYLTPWGCKLNGEVEWQGEDSDDRGMIRITDNVVEYGYAPPTTYQFPPTTPKENTMATKTPTVTANTQLPAAVPAAVLARKPKAPTSTTPGKNVHNFVAWKDALSTAQSATNYDTSSPIYGKTDIEVLTAMKPGLLDLIELAGQEVSAGTYQVNGQSVDAAVAYSEAMEAIRAIDELLKRKIAKQIAGQTYKSRKTI